MTLDMESFVVVHACSALFLCHYMAPATSQNVEFLGYIYGDIGVSRSPIIGDTLHRTNALYRPWGTYSYARIYLRLQSGWFL